MASPYRYSITPNTTASSDPLLNFLRDSRETETACTPKNYRRLTALKTVYDPDNVFHCNHTILPANDRPMGTETRASNCGHE